MGKYRPVNCEHCGIETTPNLHYCSWACRIKAAVAAGGKELLPNGLFIECINANNDMLEVQHGDHPDYITRLDIDGENADPEYPEYPQAHALIYTDGYIALTMYEASYYIWAVLTGLPLGGRYQSGNQPRLSPAAMADIQQRFKKEDMADLKIETTSEYDVSIEGLHAVEDALVNAHHAYTRATNGNDLLTTRASIDAGNNVVDVICNNLKLGVVRVKIVHSQKEVTLHLGDTPSSYSRLARVAGNVEAPVGYHWVCPSCLKKAEWKYGVNPANERKCDGGWDEQCTRDSMFTKDGEGA